MVSNEELRRALRLCVEQMCRYCRAEARAQGLPQCLEGCETLKIAKAALATDDEGETAVRKGELSKMASKNGADFGQFGNETWADIVAEMRRAKEQCNGATALFSAWLDEWADRIEVVAKRDAAIHAMTVEANERLREHLEIAIENDKRTAVGNAAAIREALRNTLDALKSFSKSHGTDLPKDVRALLGEMAFTINDALAAPARNCDLARYWLQDLYCNFKPPATVRREMPPEWVDAVMAFCQWLLAPATGRKGEGDENE